MSTHLSNPENLVDLMNLGLILVGLVSCFCGYRVFRKMIGLIGLITGAALGGLAGHE